MKRIRSQCIFIRPWECSQPFGLYREICRLAIIREGWSYRPVLPVIVHSLSRA